MSEWTLVWFTLLSQLGTGIWIALCLWGKLSRKGDFSAAIAAFGLMIISTIISTLHLHNPQNMPWVLAGLKSSWLSREILFVGLTTGLMGLSLFLRRNNKPSAILEKLTAVICLLSVISTGMVYQLPSQAAWNHSYHLMAAICLAIVCGGFLMKVWLDDGFQPGKSFPIIIGSLIVIKMILAAGFTAQLGIDTPVLLENLLNQNLIIGAWCATVILPLLVLISGNIPSTRTIVAGMTAIVLVSEVALRYEFYDLVLTRFPAF